MSRRPPADRYVTLLSRPDLIQRPCGRAVHRGLSGAAEAPAPTTPALEPPIAAGPTQRQTARAVRFDYL